MGVAALLAVGQASLLKKKIQLQAASAAACEPMACLPACRWALAMDWMRTLRSHSCTTAWGCVASRARSSISR